MFLRRLHIQARRLAHRSRLFQIGLVASFWLLGEAIVRVTGLPLPGGIIGLALALGVLFLHGMSPMSLKRGADWYLADMLLFFIPAALAIVDHREFLGLLGVKIFAIILMSTVAVMAMTALTIDLLSRWRSRHAGSVSHG